MKKRIEGSPSARPSGGRSSRAAVPVDGTQSSSGEGSSKEPSGRVALEAITLGDQLLFSEEEGDLSDEELDRRVAKAVSQVQGVK